MSASIETQAAQAAEEAARLAQQAAAARQVSEEAAAKAMAQQEAKRRRHLERFADGFDAQALAQAVTDAMRGFEAAVAEGQWAEVFGAFDRYQVARARQMAGVQQYNAALQQLGRPGQVHVPTRFATLVETLELTLGRRTQALYADAVDEFHIAAEGQ